MQRTVILMDGEFERDQWKKVKFRSESVKVYGHSIMQWPVRGFRYQPARSADVRRSACV